MSRMTTHHGASRNDLFAGLISSKTRIRLLMRFFFNPGTKGQSKDTGINDLVPGGNIDRYHQNDLSGKT